MATISLSKTMVILPYTGGSDTITITVDGSTLSSYDIVDVGGLTITRGTSSFTVSFGQNPSTGSERASNPKVTVNAADGTTKTFTVNVFQKNQNITVADSAREKTLQANESTAYFFLISDLTYTNVNYTRLFGDVSITNFRYETSENGCAVYFTTANNETSEVQSAVVLAACVRSGGADTVYLVINKNGTDGSISISPKTVTVDGSTTTRTFTVTSNQIASSSYSYNTWGDIDFDSVAYNSDHSQITATWPVNDSGETKVGYLSVIGQDVYGFTKSDYTTITQEAIPELEFTTDSRILAYNESTAYYYIKAVNVSNVSVSFSGDVSIDHHTLTADSGGYQLYVYTNNNTSTSMQETTITVSGTSGGTTLTDTATLYKKGTPGAISLNPNQATVSKASGSISSTVTADGVSNLQTSYWGDGGTTTITGVTLNNGTLTVTYGANNTGGTVTNYASVTGEDQYGDTKRATITIVQLGNDPSIVINPASRTLSATETTAYWPVRVYNVNNPTVSITGTVDIDHYTFTQDEDDETLYTLYVYTNNNTSTNQLTSTITISGTSVLGNTITGTASLVKKGTSGAIVLNPSSVSVSEVAGTATSIITTSGITSALSTEYWGDGGVTTVTNASISGSTLTVNYGSNTGSTVTNYVKVSGTDSNGDTQFATFIITQAGINPSITITPSTKTVANNEVHTTFTITSTDVSNLTMSTTDFWITDYIIENGVLSVAFGANGTTSQRSATLTVSGTTTLGTTVSATATLIQEGRQGAAGSITINPDSRTLQATETTCMYVVLTENIASALTVSKTGNVVTTDYHLTQEDFGYYLYVTTANNTGTTDLTSTFTVTGTDTSGVSRSASVTLIKKAPVAGSITVSPESRRVGYAAGSTTFTVTSSNIVGDLTLEVNTAGNMYISSYRLNGSTLTVVYGANSGEEKNGAINIRGTDVNGQRIVAIARIYQDQAPATYAFRFNPVGQSAITVSRMSTSVHYTFTSLKTVGSGSSQLYCSASITSKTGVWATNPTIQYDSNSMPYVLLPMNMGSTRTVTVTFTQDESGLTLVSTITQNGSGTVSGEFLPIWKENELTDTSGADFIEYHITLGSEIIYAGKAYKYPNASSIKWTVNDVCSNYLGNGITFSNGIHQIPDYCKTFTVETNSRIITSDTFYNSWAYDDTDYLLSDPIDYRVDPRQWLPVSFLSSRSRTINIGGVSYTASSSDNGWTVMTDLSGLTVDCNSGIVVSPSIGNSFKYNIDCGDYVLYYSNAFGGWDSLLCNATSKKTDNIEHMNYRRKSRNLSEFSKVNYQNNITPTWSLNTGITVNGHKMYHLLESTMVYLHNLKTNEIIPVVITNAQCEYLDYTNNGKKPYYYNITVEESNLKLRK